MADHHEHGKMDITEQNRTFAGFLKGTVYLCVFSGAALIFMALFNS